MILKQKKFLKELRSIFEKNNIYSILEKNNKKRLDANFWQDKSNSQKVIKEKKLHEDLINSYEKSIKELDEIKDLYDLANEENNQIVLNETLKKLKDLKSRIKKMKQNVFYLMKMMLQIVMLKYMLVQEEQKVKTGRKCLEGCI